MSEAIKGTPSNDVAAHQMDRLAPIRLKAL